MLGPILGAVGGIASAFLSKSSADKANKIAQENALRQEALQKEFAQNGIQWKVNDAKAAGVHPLFALGAQTTSYAPQTIGTATPDWSGLASAGQNIGRAMDATRSNTDRLAALQTSLLDAQVKGAHLDNFIKAQSFASAMQTSRAANPGLPTSGVNELGQGNMPPVNDGPKLKLETQQDVYDPQSKWQVPGAGPGTQLYRNNTGGFEPIIPNQLKESFENDPIGALSWAIRNRVAPNLDGAPPPNFGPQSTVTWNRWRQQWEVIERSGNRFGWTDYLPNWKDRR